MWSAYTFSFIPVANLWTHKITFAPLTGFFQKPHGEIFLSLIFCTLPFIHYSYWNRSEVPLLRPLLQIHQPVWLVLEPKRKRPLQFTDGTQTNLETNQKCKSMKLIWTLVVPWFWTPSSKLRTRWILHWPSDDPAEKAFADLAPWILAESTH